MPKRLLIPRELCFGVTERTLADGSVERRPSAAGLRRLRAELKRVTEERDILKKAAAYFARELP